MGGLELFILLVTIQGFGKRSSDVEGNIDHLGYEAFLLNTLALDLETGGPCRFFRCLVCSNMREE